MELVIVESPYAGDVDLNLEYVRRAMRDCLERGEAPFPSHALYTQPGVLDDGDPTERKLGMEAGFAWGLVADKVAVYLDLGVSAGMDLGIKKAQERGMTVVYRRFGDGWCGRARAREYESVPVE